MSIKINNKKKLMSLSISGDLTIYTANEYRDSILEKFSAEKNIEIDLAEVEEIDSSGLQLLAAMNKEITSHGCEMQLVSVSDVVIDALETSCLINDFKCSKQEN